MREEGLIRWISIAVQNPPEKRIKSRRGVSARGLMNFSNEGDYGMRVPKSEYERG